MPQPIDRKQCQAVRIELADGSIGIFYGPLQLDMDAVTNGEELVSVEVFDPIPLANGLSWMLIADEDERG